MWFHISYDRIVGLLHASGLDTGGVVFFISDQSEGRMGFDWLTLRNRYATHYNAMYCVKQMLKWFVNICDERLQMLQSVLFLITKNAKSENCTKTKYLLIISCITLIWVRMSAKSHCSQNSLITGSMINCVASICG